MTPAEPVDPPAAPGVAVVGCGPWGTNLVRTFAALGALRSVVDIDPAAAGAASAAGGVPARPLDEVLTDATVDAVVVAVPAADHFAVARQALDAGKHVFVEKPLALTVDDAAALCASADERGRVLMVGHLVRYHPAFVALQRLVDGGDLGAIRYVYSNRLNLGRVRRHEDTLWSFAPHDVSMILALVGQEPERVWATGAAWLQDAVADVTTTHLSFPGGQRAHVFVSWLHPFKEQKLVVVGERAMAVFDDGRPWHSKLQVFRHGISSHDGVVETVPAEGERVALDEREPLEAECRHFLDCVASGSRPLTDGREGLRVLRVLAAAAEALPGRAARSGVFVHDTAVVDEPATIGEGTRIWHFSHVLSGSTIGKDCVIGQNALIGPGVVVGDRCKIQNNVSVYKGVTLEDGVFCGPSCVFTNVRNPRADIDRKAELLPTLVRRGATIGANATIVCGNTIGPWSFVAAGAVVTADVPAHALVAGVPARRIGWVSHAGERLGDDLVCPRTGRRYALVGPDQLVEVKDGADGDDHVEPVPLVDLAAQRRRLGRRVDRAIAAVLSHGRFVMGPEVARLEGELARYCGVGHAVTCASGTDALVLALLALGVGSGDAVVVPAFTFAATAEAVAFVGATPVFADVSPDTCTLDPAGAAAALEEAERRGLRPAGLLAVDLFGHPADYDALGDVAARRGAWVMADAAQSFGAGVGGRRVGSLAAVTTTSFFPAKPLGCYGDGGAAFTDDDDLAARMRSLRVHGNVGGEHVALGVNGRLDTVQAAVLLEKLAVFEDELAARQDVARRYGEALTGLVRVPVVGHGVTSAWACYTIRATERDKLAARLQDDGIATATYYDRPLPAHAAYRSFPRAPGGLAVSEALSRQVLSLPMHPYLDAPTQDRVVGAVRSALA